jgi:CRISPR/Cas system-associated protein Csm6
VLSGKTIVLVEAFYWGVRQMVEQLSYDISRITSAETFLKSI